MEIILKLMLTSLLVFIIMLFTDIIFEVSNMKNYWLREVYPFVGSMSAVVTIFLFFIYFLVLIWN